MSRPRPPRERQPVRNSAELRALARERLIASRLTPNAISITGLVLNLAAAGLVVADLLLAGGIAFVVGSVMDTLDGRYSRMSGKGSPFGAFLDSTLDRIEEGAVLTAIAWRFADAGEPLPAAACVATVLGSLMVSYTRARAEALGVQCTVGVATRPVRVAMLSVGLVLGGGELIPGVDLLAPAIYAVAALTAFTTVQRVWHVRGELQRIDRPAPAAVQRNGAGEP